ncbi:MAG: TROVE domain-containing protein [Candidatus Eremiobacteraeota bacterium]|nr:TROVE domain-containing protein [Candidatus Eremiobacteraeota bacterium]
MARMNRKDPAPPRTHEGARAVKISPELELRRSVLATMLWEDQFYEEGESIASRVQSLVSRVEPEKVAALAIEARIQMKLRHMPLLIAREMARSERHRPFVAKVLGEIIQRADELGEFLALYWNEGKKPLSKQVKKGLALAFPRFDAYQLAKYNRGGLVTLRDVMFLVHPKPRNDEQAEIWKRLAGKTLEAPDTWEVNLSAGKDKKESWERLLREKKLGAMALLRNLRNMLEAKVDEELVKDALEHIHGERVLPFRFVSAARHAPQWEGSIEKAMLRSLEGAEKLPGKTILIVDVSGSMYYGRVSAHSEMDRAKVACALAVLVRELCEKPVIYATAGDDGRRVHATERVPERRGFSLSDAIYSLTKPLGGGGIFLKQVMDYVYEKEKDADRIIVITDEQDCGIAKGDEPAGARAFGRRNYLINVASYKNGIAYGTWHHIDGWSDAVLRYIGEFEKLPLGEQESFRKEKK